MNSLRAGEFRPRKLLEVVVPSFNEGDELRLAVNRLIEKLQNSAIEDFRIRVVVDGPDPQTISAANDITDERVLIEILPMNMGKGFAIRKGFLAAESDYIAFIDGDLDISPQAIVDGLFLLQRETNGLVGCAYGSKFHPDSQVKYPTMRRIFSATYRFAVRCLFGLSVDDTQTGIKVFRREAILDHLDKLNQNGFLFDIEIMARMSAGGWKCNAVPVCVDYNYSSTIKPKTVIQMMMQTVQLAIQLWRPDGSSGGNHNVRSSRFRD
jgi:glycosyltransferase involved in cell wall biosynthesis